MSGRQARISTILGDMAASIEEAQAIAVAQIGLTGDAASNARTKGKRAFLKDRWEFITTEARKVSDSHPTDKELAESAPWPLSEDKA